jgi:hypothetical protein
LGEEGEVGHRRRRHRWNLVQICLDSWQRRRRCVGPWRSVGLFMGLRNFGVVFGRGEFLPLCLQCCCWPHRARELSIELSSGNTSLQYGSDDGRATSLTLKVGEFFCTWEATTLDGWGLNHYVWYG